MFTEGLLLLTRIRAVKKARTDWPSRWSAAAESVNYKGVYFRTGSNDSREMVASFRSPIWKALARGVGGFKDAIGEGKPPFAFGSGLGWEKIKDTKGLVLADEQSKSTNANNEELNVKDTPERAIEKTVIVLPREIELKVKFK